VKPFQTPFFSKNFKLSQAKPFQVLKLVSFQAKPFQIHFSFKSNPFNLPSLQIQPLLVPFISSQTILISIPFKVKLKHLPFCDF